MDGARNGEDVLALFGRQPRRDQRAGLERRLHHQHALRQAGNNPVALGKVGVERRRTERKFADQEALLRDSVRQFEVLFGVDPVQSGADHRHGSAATLQGTVMRSAIDAQRQARHHTQTGGRKCLGELPGIDFPLRRGVATAHDGKLHRG